MNSYNEYQWKDIEQSGAFLLEWVPGEASTERARDMGICAGLVEPTM